MKLLMITRKVDRSEHLAGFIYNWVKKMSTVVDQLIVISWQAGDSSGLPENVRVIHLPTKQSKVLKVINFKKVLWQNIKKVDGVFCHQMPLYTILAAPLAKLYGKKVVSWYTHGQVDWKMKLMEKLADVILTASKESFRLPSKKVKVVGHGIDLDIFRRASTAHNHMGTALISVGRISPTKDYETMIKAVQLLTSGGLNDIRLSIIGDVGLVSQNMYLTDLKTMITKMNLQDKVVFLGAKPNHEIAADLQHADIFINLSGTGSLDKAVLEAMACGCLVLTSNEAFDKILPAELKTQRDNPQMLAEKIKQIMVLPDERKQQLRSQLRQEVVANHNLDNLVKTIVSQFNGKTS